MSLTSLLSQIKDSSCMKSCKGLQCLVPSLREILQLNEVQTLRCTDSLDRLMKIHLLLYPHQVKPCFSHSSSWQCAMCSFQTPGQTLLCSQRGTAKLTGPASSCELPPLTNSLFGKHWVRVIASFDNTANQKSLISRLLNPTLPGLEVEAQHETLCRWWMPCIFSSWHKNLDQLGYFPYWHHVLILRVNSFVTHLCLHLTSIYARV